MYGCDAVSDLYLASRFLRKSTAEAILPACYQKQAYDHVLGEKELERNAFEGVCHYIAENSVRAGIVNDAKVYPFTGSIVVGYPDLRLHKEGYWDLFWRIVHL
jgi:putative transposase